VTNRTGYKLFRLRKDGTLGSLFINRRAKLPIGEWMVSEEHPTKGFAFRPSWHVLAEPNAPHLSTKDRVWYKVEMQGTEEMKRPPSQGGIWYLADKIRIISEVT
jgi:hypothetical protein